MSDQHGQSLVNEFYDALQSLDLARCQTKLDELAKYAKTDLAYEDWYHFFYGVVKRVFFHDLTGAETIFQTLLNKDISTDLRGLVLNSLGITYRFQGQWDAALQAYEQGLELVTPTDHLIQWAKIQNNMATVLELGYTQGDFGLEALDQADDHCQQVLHALQTVETPSRDELLLEAATWNTRGIIYRDFEKWSQAIACFERYLALSHNLDLLYDIGIASNNIGEVLQIQGPDTWADAYNAYTEACNAYRAYGDKHLEIDVLANLSSLQEAMGDQVQALEHYAQAIVLIESLRKDVGEAHARASFFATMTDIYAHAVRLSIELNRLDEAFHYVERARARAFLDLLESGSPYLINTQTEDVLTLDQVQANLPPHTLLLAYFTMGLIDPKARSKRNDSAYRHRQPPERVYVFTITNKTIKSLVLPLSPNQILPQRLTQIVEKYFLNTEQLTYFFEALIAPIKDQLTDKKRLYIVPHGPLHYIPFQALMTNEPDLQETPNLDNVFLFDQAGLHIAYATSVTILLRHCRVGATVELTPALALGYNGSGPTELDHPEAEAVAIAEMLGGRALDGALPKKNTLFSFGKQAKLIHIACHGHFIPTEPMASFLELGLDEKLTAQEVVDQLNLPPHSLVTMSACESGLSQVLRSDELMGLTRAFILAGAAAVVCTMWRVEEVSTYILMKRFYQNIRQGLPLTKALKQAQQYLRQLTYGQVEALLSDAQMQRLRYLKSSESHIIIPDFPSPSDVSSSNKNATTKIFKNPYYWAPFILIGGFEGPEFMSPVK